MFKQMIVCNCIGFISKKLQRLPSNTSVSDDESCIFTNPFVNAPKLINNDIKMHTKRVISSWGCEKPSNGLEHRRVR